MKPTFYSRFGKRCLDLAFATPGLILISPALLAAAVSVRLSSCGPVFFRQIRVGQNGSAFHVLKFRTMIENASTSAALVTAANDPRITRIGRFLRNTKLDELPQLWNVIRGEIGLVGPRPEVPKFTAGYTPAQKAVLSAAPGVTGPAAITFVHEEELLARQSDPELFYRTTLLPAKLELDLAYCENIRLSNDLRLLFSTIFRLLEPKRIPPRPEPAQTETAS